MRLHASPIWQHSRCFWQPTILPHWQRHIYRLILACGVCKTGVLLIVFRALHQIAIFLCLPSSISITTSTSKPGQRKDVGFACLGGAQPMGFLVGLGIGAVLTDSIGWRPAIYLIAGINAAVFCMRFFAFRNRLTALGDQYCSD